MHRVKENRDKRDRTGAFLRCLLLTVMLAGGPPSQAQELDLTGGVTQFVDRSAEQSLLEGIEKMEARDGAYAAGLAEQMLSLGLALQQQDRHSEAMEIFKRGVHLARINNGLHCAEQIPLLEGEIRSSVALGEYARVDQLQQYLYRVQLRGLPGGEERAAALLKQATWQFNAYQLGLGTQGSERLATMWDLYQQAWKDLEASETDTSPKLLPPLYGMLRTQYLISEYSAENEQMGNINSEANRFYNYRGQNYQLGRSVILAIYKIQSSTHGQNSQEALDALTALGDWALWNSKGDDAMVTYRLALTELAARDDAQQEGGLQLFAEPVPLPDIRGLRKLPPAVDAEQGNILLEFGVDSRGQVVDLERLDTNEDIDTKAERLIRVLRNTTFRPRFDAGQPAGTEKLVRAYEIKP